MCDAGHPKLVLCGNLEGWGREGCGRGQGGMWAGVQGGGDICLPMTDSY